MKTEYIALLWLFVLSLLYVLVFSSTTSPILYGKYSIDQQIFYYMGYSMLAGKIPYIDLFDHKGLIVYFVNALGIAINESWGILLLQVINLFLTSVLWYKSLLFFDKLWLKLLVCSVGVFCLLPFYDNGAMTEEWSLLFISYPFYAYFRKEYHDEKYFSRSTLFLIGLCLGMVSMIRLNNMAPALGIVIFCACDAIWKKEYHYLISAFGFVLLGALVPILMCVFYMIERAGMKGLDSMFYSTILFNLEYTKNFGTNGSFHLLNTLKFLYKPLIPVAVLPFFIKKSPRYVLPILIGVAIGLLTMGKAMFTHYLLILIPLMVYSFVVIDKRVAYIVICLVLAVYSKFYYRHSYNFTCTKQDRETLVLKEMVDKIPINERMHIWNYNAPVYLYDCAAIGLLQDNRMLLPMQIDLSQRLKTEEYRKIEKEKPSFVLLVKYDSEVMKSLCSYSGTNYDMQFLNDNYTIMAREVSNRGDTIVCLKRNGM